MKMTIRKYHSWQEVEQDSVNFWQEKSDQERLEAMNVLVSRYFLFNPKHRSDARPFPDIYPVVKRRGR